MRKESEFESQHIKGATNFPLDFINTNLNNLDSQSKWYIHCAGGYRSMIATSILLSSGYYNAVNIKGGFKALKETALPMTEFQEQITML